MGEAQRPPEETPEEKPRRKTREEMMAEILEKDREQFDVLKTERQRKLHERSSLTRKEHEERINQGKEEHKLAQERLKKGQEELKRKNEEIEKLRKSLGL